MIIYTIVILFALEVSDILLGIAAKLSHSLNFPPRYKSARKTSIEPERDGLRPNAKFAGERVAVSLNYTKPSPALMRELEEVAHQAAALASFVAASNVPLDGFPSEQLKQICVALGRLPQGTAEGCREPLVYARKRLPAIRREHVVPAGAETKAGAGDAAPSVRRGQGLDHHLKDLLASVTTALDQYQAEARVELSDSVEQEIGVNAAEIDSFAEAIQKSEALDPLLAAAGAATAQLIQAGVAGTDRLKRQLVDVETQNQTARTEAQMPEIRLSWYQPLVAQLRKMPEIIEKTVQKMPDFIEKFGRLVQRSADTAETLSDASKPFRDIYRDYKQDLFKVALDTTRKTGLAFERFGQDLKTKLDKKKAAPGKPDESFDIEKVYAMIIAGIEPPLSWRPSIDKLDFRNAKITDLAPLGRLTALRELCVTGRSVADLVPLAGLRTLESLYLPHTGVSDLAPLARLRNLAWLDLTSTAVTDLAPLAGLITLLDLDLTSTAVSYLAPLAGLTALIRLVLNDTSVSELAPLASLKVLQQLDLRGTPVSDLKPLATLSMLKMLYLNNTSVSDLTPLVDLRSLERLDLRGTSVSDLRPLERLIGMRTLNLSNTPVSYLKPLATLSMLKTLYLDNTSVSDLTPLVDLRSLERLDLRGTSVSHLRPVERLIAMKTLNLSNTPVSDLSPLTGLTALKDIYVESEDRRKFLVEKFPIFNKIIKLNSNSSGFLY